MYEYSGCQKLFCRSCFAQPLDTSDQNPLLCYLVKIATRSFCNGLNPPSCDRPRGSQGSGKTLVLIGCNLLRMTVGYGCVPVDMLRGLRLP